MLLSTDVRDVRIDVCLRTTAPTKEHAVGRKALAKLAGDEVDVAALTFPHRCASIAHSGEIAVAALAQAEPRLLGVGVDFEPIRPIRRETSRFFLTHAEHVVAADLSSSELLRLWTIKEALYKATPHNRDTVFVDLVITEPGELNGAAGHQHRPGHGYHYVSMVAAGGWLTVATCFMRRPIHAA